MSQDLLSEIEAFLAEHDVGPSYFGKAACGNSELVSRLRKGKTVTLVTADRVRTFMEAERVRRATPQPAEAAQ